MDNEATYYADCILPLPLFIKGSVHKDKTVLILSGTPTEEQLDQAWLSVNSEFLEITGDPIVAAYSAEVNRINELRARLLWVSVAVESLRMNPSETIIEELRTEDFGLDLDPTDPERFESDLKRVMIEIIQDEIELEKLLDKQGKDAEIEAANKQNRPPQTESYFDEILLEISHKEQLRYRAQDLTTREFAHLVKRLKRHHKAPPQPEY